MSRIVIVEVEVTLQLTVSQSVRQGIESTLGLVTRYYVVLVYHRYKPIDSINLLG
jgi:hypothetical protein